ncbi:hypothetical protein ACFQ1L_32655 [Phytohabitans flavus]|uniref:hypothetical protein n=1 Tax=Phytohabitans flavus TaxID=1076124 RepID=UPI003626C3D3
MDRQDPDPGGATSASDWSEMCTAPASATRAIICGMAVTRCRRRIGRPAGVRAGTTWSHTYSGSRPGRSKAS